MSRTPLPKNEDDEDYGGAYEETDDAGGGPGIGDSTPLESHENHDDAWDEESSADKIQSLNSCPNRFVLDSSGGRMEHENQCCNRDTSDWQVDVEYPSPRNMFCKSTTDQWSSGR